MVKDLVNNSKKPMIKYHPNYSIIENGQNTEKSPGELRRFAVTQTPVKSQNFKKSENAQILGSCKGAETKLWNIKAMMKQIAFGPLGTILKYLKKYVGISD